MFVTDPVNPGGVFVYSRTAEMGRNLTIAVHKSKVWFRERMVGKTYHFISQESTQQTTDAGPSTNIRHSLDSDERQIEIEVEIDRLQAVVGSISATRTDRKESNDSRPAAPCTPDKRPQVFR